MQWLMELDAVFGNLMVFLPWSSVYELLLSLFDISCFILYYHLNSHKKKIPGQIVDIINNLLLDEQLIII